MSLLLFLYCLFLISPCPHLRVYLQYRTIVQINSQTRRSNSSNSLDFCSSKTITSILLLSVVLLKPIHAMTFHTKFLLFVLICVPPNNPITACGATSFPGYHSFPKWAIAKISVTSPVVINMQPENYLAFDRNFKIYSEVPFNDLTIRRKPLFLTPANNSNSPIVVL